MPRGRTFDQAPRARKLHAKGWSCNRIAKELGWAPSTISAWAKREGLSFDRTMTQDAVAAARLTRAERRSRIIDRLYDRADFLQDRLEAPTFSTLVPAGMGESTTRDLEYVPSAEEKNLATSISTNLSTAARLELVDTDQGVGPVESMLGRLAERFGLG